MKYAVNYVLGGQTEVIVVEASNHDIAFVEAGFWLQRRGFCSASLQGPAHPASQEEILKAHDHCMRIEAFRSRQRFLVLMSAEKE